MCCICTQLKQREGNGEIKTNMFCIVLEQLWARNRLILSMYFEYVLSRRTKTKIQLGSQQ